MRRASRLLVCLFLGFSAAAFAAAEGLAAPARSPTATADLTAAQSANGGLAGAFVEFLTGGRGGAVNVAPTAAAEPPVAAAPSELPETFPAPYGVPVSPTTRSLLFQNLDVEPEDLIQEIETHGLTGSLMDRLHPPTTAHRLRPLMPLRRGHLALVLASGHLNNELVRNPRTGERFRVKGRTEKRSIRTETHAEDDTLVIIDRDTLRIVITALDLRTGKVRTME